MTGENGPTPGDTAAVGTGLLGGTILGGGGTMLAEGGAIAAEATNPVGWFLLGGTIIYLGWRALHSHNQQADDRATPTAPAAVCDCPADANSSNSRPPSANDPPTDIYIDPNKYPEAAGHVQDAQDAGHPSEGTIDRDGASARRRAATSGTSTQAGNDRDEYPPAIVQQGGAGSSVRSIPSGDNRGAGASMGAQIRDLPDGSRIRIVPGRPQ